MAPHNDFEQAPDFAWPQLEDTETNQVVTTIKNVVNAFMKNQTQSNSTPVAATEATGAGVQETTMTSLINLVTGSATAGAGGAQTPIPDILTATTQNNDTLLTEMAQNNNTILTDMARNNSTVLTEMAQNNSTVLTDIFQSNNTVSMMETVENTMVDNATAITESVRDVVVTTTENVVTTVSEAITSLAPGHPNETDHFVGGFEDGSVDNTLYIVVGTILAIFLLIVVVLLVIYKKYKLGNLRSRTNAYCVNDLKQGRVSSGHDRKGGNC